MTDAEKISAALALIVSYGSVDGDHHKAWVLDQIARTLAGENYDALVATARMGEDGPETYDWNCGIAP